jgi:hypothetical protein
VNRRSIAIQLMRKHKDFLESIEDTEIKQRVAEDSIITGGCIASMLLNEKVSDYDYYFTNKRTTLAVTKYYTNLFTKKREANGKEDSFATIPVVYTEKNNEKVKETEDFDRVRIMLKSSGIAGTNTNLKDYEYFETMSSEEETERYLGDIIESELPSVEELLIEGDKVDAEKLEKEGKYQPLYISDNAITLSGKIQLVIRFFGTPKEIHDNFDYVHCTNYFVPKAGKLVLTKLATESLLAKELKYMGSLYPVCSIIRLRKFLKNGWHINAGQLLKICLQISKLDLENIRVLEDQLTGVDTAYFSELIRKLKVKQELDADFVPDMPYVASLVDKIFG